MKLISEETSSALPSPADDRPLPPLGALKVRAMLGKASIVLVGMMGAGKSSIGRRLAQALDIPFFDADAEIERAASMSVEEIFKKHGEAYFREGEEKVIRRLLESGPQILATGGGAVMSEATRQIIAGKGVSIWLNAPLDLLMKRVARRDNRPLLKTADPQAIMEQLYEARKAYYAEADLTFACRDAPHQVIIEEIIELLAAYLEVAGPSGSDKTASNGAQSEGSVRSE